MRASQAIRTPLVPRQKDQSASEWRRSPRLWTTLVAIDGDSPSRPRKPRAVSTRRRTEVDVVTVAVRGRSATSAISPTKSPAPRSLTLLPLRVTRREPSTTTKTPVRAHLRGSAYGPRRGRRRPRALRSASARPSSTSRRAARPATAPAWRPSGVAPAEDNRRNEGRLIGAGCSLVLARRGATLRR